MTVHILSVTFKCHISTLKTSNDKHKYVSSYEVKNMFGLSFLNDKQLHVLIFKIKLSAFQIYIFITSEII